MLFLLFYLIKEMKNLGKEKKKKTEKKLKIYLEYLMMKKN